MNTDLIEEKISEMEKIAFFNYDNFSEQKISKKIKNKLMEVLNEINIAEIPNEFKTKFEKNMAELLRLNEEHKILLKGLLPNDKITDLNSAVMGIPNTTDSDVDFTIPIQTKDSQKHIASILKENGFSFKEELDEKDWNKGSYVSLPFNRLNYIKIVESGKEIEVKLRHHEVVKDVLIAHRGIRDNLLPEQKLKISFLKSVLKDAESKFYEGFKKMIYTAMFDGHEKSFVMGAHS
jgi:hypothetical protein